MSPLPIIFSFVFGVAFGLVLAVTLFRLWWGLVRSPSDRARVMTVMMSDDAEYAAEVYESLLLELYDKHGAAFVPRGILDRLAAAAAAVNARSPGANDSSSADTRRP